MDSPLKTVALEGIFYIDEATKNLMVQKDDGTAVSVEAGLESLIGRQVRLAVMHVPPHGAQEGHWGLGSCHWRPYGTCPAGHHEDPDRLLVFSQEGSLQKERERWALHGFDGSKREVPLGLMVGHYGRVLGATTDTVEKMRDILTKMDPNQQAEVLTGQAAELRDALDRVRKATGSS